MQFLTASSVCIRGHTSISNLWNFNRMMIDLSFCVGINFEKRDQIKDDKARSVITMEFGSPTPLLYLVHPTRGADVGFYLSKCLFG